MGTRNLTCVISDSEYKVAQYGQWDGYPSGQGATILNFISSGDNLQRLARNLSRVRFIDDKDKDFLASYNANAPTWSNDPDSRTPEQKHWFGRFSSRDIGGEILANIAADDGEGEILLRDSKAFAGDSLFCEFAYVVDLDAGMFEVYKGFNKSPVESGRFLSSDDGLEHTDGYHPVVMLKAYSFSELPDVDVFVEEIEALIDDE
jgi:hypothetical protein